MKKYLLLTIMITLVACAGPLKKSGKIANGPVEFQTILAGQHSMADTAFVNLISDQSDWDDTWILASGKINPLPITPTVDFKLENVIAAFMGQRPSSGFRIEIVSIDKRDNILDVFIKKYETPGMLTVITNPYCLVRLPKGDYDLNIIEEIVE